MMLTLGLVALALAALSAVIAGLNLMILRPPEAPGSDDTLVSILIPARDEAARIGAALDAARASVGVAIEILVMDDGSSDATPAIVAEHAARDPRVRLLAAPPLPEGWTGKVHACHRLAQAARGGHLLFVDADVRLRPDTAARLVAHARQTGAGLVSAVPRQVIGSLAELLTVPMVNFLLVGYLPIRMLRASRDPSLGAACGQLVLVETSAYRAVGGHEAIHALLHDGIQLARAFRRRGHATDLVAGADLASCRMYENFGEAWAGFAKNAHEGMATPVALPIWTCLLFGGHVLPVILAIAAPTLPACLALGLSLATRAAVTLHGRETLLEIPFHPATILVGLAIQWSALLRRHRGRQAGWKDRLYPVA